MDHKKFIDSGFKGCYKSPNFLIDVGKMTKINSIINWCWRETKERFARR